jgi:hypothetical protein
VLDFERLQEHSPADRFGSPALPPAANATDVRQGRWTHS